MKLHRSILPEGVSLERKEGLYAQLGPQEQVLHVGVYEGGKLKPQSWSLDVAPDGSWARAQKVEVVEWPPAPNEEGDEEEEPPGLKAFALEWIERIAEPPQPRPSFVCSFCGKTQQEVKKLIAGPSVFICDECVGLCNDILSSEAASGE